MITQPIRRVILIMIALAVALLTLPDVATRSAQRLFAQDQFTVTPTFTFTWTPTWTPTWTVTPFFTPTWTPTWTPVFPLQTPPTGPTATKPFRIVTEISEPKPGDALAGFAPIRGTALSPSYRRYELHISPAGMDNWTWLHSSYDVVHDGHLYGLDTRQFPDGMYDLRLRTIRDDGNYIEAFAPGLEIRNANPPTFTPAYDAAGILISAPPISPLDTPTPTPRSPFVQNIPGGQGIISPEIGEQVAGYVNIIGTANGQTYKRFDRYEIAISPAGDGNWEWLYTSSDQIWQNTLYILDSRLFPDGYYDIRLRIVYEDSNYDDYTLRYLGIANDDQVGLSSEQQPGIHSPRSHSSATGIVDFVGTAVDPNFLRWEMYWSPAGQNSWSYLTEDDRPVVNRTLARLDLSKLTGSQIDVLLRIVRQDTNYSDYVTRSLYISPPATATPVLPSPTPFVTPTPLG